MKLTRITVQAADDEDASFLYVPIGLTVTVFCPLRHILVGATTYTCTDEGFDPPIQISNFTDKVSPRSATESRGKCSFIIDIML